MMYSGRRLALLAPLASLLLPLPEARACPDELPPIWHPQRSWPAACEPDVPNDGFVLLEGDALERGDPRGQGVLEIVLQRTQAGEVIETIAGTLSYPDATSALFRADRPLAPNADYLVSARRNGASDDVPSFTTAFTTGSRALSPLGFRHAPSAQLEASERERFACARDSCGAQHCAPTGESEPAQLVRIEVPPIGGGIEQKPYAVSAEFVASATPGQAPLVATSDVAVTQAGRRSFIVIELPAAAATEGLQGCVTVTAEDVAGHTATTEPVCLTLFHDAPGAHAASPDAQATDVRAPSGSQSNDEGEETPDELAYTQTIGAASATAGDDAQANSSGCAIGARGDVRGLAWLAPLLVWLRTRRRKTA